MMHALTIPMLMQEPKPRTKNRNALFFPMPLHPFPFPYPENRFVSYRNVHNLTRIHDPVRVQTQLDTLHYIQGLPSHLH